MIQGFLFLWQNGQTPPVVISKFLSLPLEGRISRINFEANCCDLGLKFKFQIQLRSLALGWGWTMVLLAQLTVFTENSPSEKKFQTSLSSTLLIGMAMQLILSMILAGKQFLRLYNCQLLVCL